MSFEDYLKSKSIDPTLYKAGKEEQYIQFESEFNQMHPKSFTAQKLFLINDLRRTYLYEKVDEASSLENKGAVKAKPKIKPKVSTNNTKPVIKKVAKPVVKKQVKPVIKRPKTD